MFSVTFAAGIGDVRPFENSTGQRVRRGSITKAGNSRFRRVLIEGAWTYRFPARISRLLQERQAALTKAMSGYRLESTGRLYGRYRKLMAVGKCQIVVTVAIVREMSAVLWPIEREMEPHPVA